MHGACLWRLGAAASVVVASGLLAPIASAAIPLGGGAGIVVDGTYCTLATIGHDNTGELVGFTAASCGGPGAPVVAEGAENGGVLGTVATVDEDLDYEVITFDARRVVPVADFDGFAIDGIGPDPSFGQPACTQGGATGFGCGQITLTGTRPATIGANMSAWQPGNEGAPITVEGQLVGMICHGRNKLLLPVPIIINKVRLTLFSAILDDVNAKGGPAAGFSPVSPA